MPRIAWTLQSGLLAGNIDNIQPRSDVGNQRKGHGAQGHGILTANGLGAGPVLTWWSIGKLWRVALALWLLCGLVWTRARGRRRRWYSRTDIFGASGCRGVAVCIDSNTRLHGVHKGRLRCQRVL